MSTCKDFIEKFDTSEAKIGVSKLFYNDLLTQIDNVKGSIKYVEGALKSDLEKWERKEYTAVLVSDKKQLAELKSRIKKLVVESTGSVDEKDIYKEIKKNKKSVEKAIALIDSAIKGELGSGDEGKRALAGLKDAALKLKSAVNYL